MPQDETPARLYHFTAAEHLPRILNCGHLHVAESNVGAPHDSLFVGGPMGDHYARDVVWLTDVAEPAGPEELGLDLEIGRLGKLQLRTLDKLAVRITVEVHDAKLWVPWAKRKRIHPLWLEALTEGRAAEHWWIVAREVPKSQWVTIEKRGSTGWTGSP